MGKVLYIFLTILLANLRITKTHIVCDCDNLKTKAVIDLSVPDYCSHEDHHTHTKPKWVHYTLLSEKKPAYKFDAFMCEMWVNERVIKGSFWVGSYDTTNRQYTRGVTLDDCKILIEKKLCNGQKAEEQDGTYKYEAHPQEVTGYWMSTTTYSITNCVGRRITLYQDNPNSPIISPLGILPGASYDDGVAYFNQKVIMWHKSPVERRKWLSCEPHHLYESNGMMTHTQKQGRITDSKHQIEILFMHENKTICIKGADIIKGHPVFGLPGGFIQYQTAPSTIPKVKGTITRSRRKAQAITFDSTKQQVEEEGEEHFIWNPVLTDEQIQQIENIELYRDYTASGFIYPIAEPEKVITAIEPFIPVILDEKLKDGENYKIQQFKLENYKIVEIEPQNFAAFCLSIFKRAWNETIIRTQSCHSADIPMWNMTVPSEWLYDIKNNLIIEIKNNLCLTRIKTEVTALPCKSPTDINQQWKFEKLILNKDIHSREFKTFNYDDAHIDEYIQFIQNKEQIITVSKLALAYGRIKQIPKQREEINNNFDRPIGTVKENQKCIAVREEMGVAVLLSCIAESSIDYHKPVQGHFQDFELHPDFTIRRTGSNLCLNTLSPKKKSSQRYLFGANNTNPTLYKPSQVMLSNCVPGTTRWFYDANKGQLRAIEILDETTGCLTTEGNTMVVSKCIDSVANQIWQFDYENTEAMIKQKLKPEMLDAPDFFYNMSKLTDVEKFRLYAPMQIPKVFKEVKKEKKEKQKNKGLEIMDHTMPGDNKLPPAQPPPSIQAPPAHPPAHSSPPTQAPASKGHQGPGGGNTNKLKLLFHSMQSHTNGSSTADIAIDQLEDFVKTLIKPLHEQFKTDVRNDHENELAAEIRSVYCIVAKQKRHQMMITAQISPILAAIMMGLKPCERLEGFGEMILLQECNAVTVKIQNHHNRCGNQPFFTHRGYNATIGADGFSIVKLTGDADHWCFWRNNHFVNINGHTSFWKHTPGNVSDGDWETQKPTVHGTHLALIKQYEEFPVNDNDFELRGHSFHEKTEFEQLNILMELAGRATQYESDHLGAIVSNENREAHMIDMFSWTKVLRIIALVFVILVALALFLKAFKYFNPLPMMDEIVNNTKQKFKNNAKVKEMQKDDSLEINTPSAPPIYASLITAPDKTTSFFNKDLNEITNDTLSEDVKKVHSHFKCSYIKGKGLVWDDGCMCSTETR